MEPLLSSIAAVTEQIAKADEQIAQLAEASYPETKLLRQVKGVGPLIALTYVVTVGDPHRFAKSRTVGSYLGLRPRQRESGSSAPQLGISKAEQSSEMALDSGRALHLGSVGARQRIAPAGLRFVR